MLRNLVELCDLAHNSRQEALLDTKGVSTPPHGSRRASTICGYQAGQTRAPCRHFGMVSVVAVDGAPGLPSLMGGVRPFFLGKLRGQQDRPLAGLRAKFTAAPVEIFRSRNEPRCREDAGAPSTSPLLGNFLAWRARSSPFRRRLKHVGAGLRPAPTSLIALPPLPALWPGEGPGEWGRNSYSSPGSLLA